MAFKIGVIVVCASVTQSIISMQNGSATTTQPSPVTVGDQRALTASQQALKKRQEKKLAHRGHKGESLETARWLGSHYPS